jgi:hypothetical protein
MTFSVLHVLNAIMRAKQKLAQSCLAFDKWFAALANRGPKNIFGPPDYNLFMLGKVILERLLPCSWRLG